MNANHLILNQDKSKMLILSQEDKIQNDIEIEGQDKKLIPHKNNNLPGDRNKRQPKMEFVHRRQSKKLDKRTKKETKCSKNGPKNYKFLNRKNIAEWTVSFKNAVWSYTMGWCPPLPESKNTTPTVRGLQDSQQSPRP